MNHVPYSYVQKAKSEWWKYVIPQTFTAYKPDEIEGWSVDKILEHLAAISEIKRQSEGGEK